MVYRFELLLYFIRVLVEDNAQFYYWYNLTDEQANPLSVGLHVSPSPLDGFPNGTMPFENKYIP